MSSERFCGTTWHSSSVSNDLKPTSVEAGGDKRRLDADPCQGQAFVVPPLQMTCILHSKWHIQYGSNKRGM